MDPLLQTRYYVAGSGLTLRNLSTTSYANLALLVSLVIAVVWLSWPFVIRKRLARLSPDRRFVALAMMGVLACRTFMTFLFSAHPIDSKGDENTVNRICFLYVSPWLVCLPVSIGVYAFIATRRPLMLPQGKRAVVCLARLHPLRFRLHLRGSQQNANPPNAVECGNSRGVLAETARRLRQGKAPR